jgi:hypothetical protein
MSVAYIGIKHGDERLDGKAPCFNNQPGECLGGCFCGDDRRKYGEPRKNFLQEILLPAYVFYCAHLLLFVEFTDAVHKKKPHKNLYS